MLQRNQQEKLGTFERETNGVACVGPRAECSSIVTLNEVEKAFAKGLQRAAITNHQLRRQLYKECPQTRSQTYILQQVRRYVVSDIVYAQNK